ncbi:MAG: hypothetical protein IKW27_03695, partial [Bacteroidales bacterium]|nr:hypothetical protein [Bacteroidales bacterium]
SSTEAEFKFARVILDPRESGGGEAPLSTAFVTGGAIAKPNDRNEGSFTTLQFNSDKVEFGFDADYCIAAAIIVSRKNEDDTWLRSSAQMTANQSSSERFYSLQYCLDAIEQGGIQTESSRYLNNAGVGNGVAEPATPFTVNSIKINNVSKSVPLNNESYVGAMQVTINSVTGTGDNDGSNVLKVYDGSTQVGTDMAIAVDGTVTGGTITVPGTTKTYTIKMYNGAALKQTLGTIQLGGE